MLIHPLPFLPSDHGLTQLRQLSCLVSPPSRFPSVGSSIHVAAKQLQQKWRCTRRALRSDDPPPFPPGVCTNQSTARFAARRLGSQISYVASNVFLPRDDAEGASSSPPTAAAGLGATTTAGMMSPRSKKAEKVRRTVRLRSVDRQRGKFYIDI